MSMKLRLLLAGFAAVSAFVIWEGFLGNAASFRLIGGFLAAGILALLVGATDAKWGVWTKWAFVAVALIVAFSIISGPLNYFQLE